MRGDFAGAEPAAGWRGRVGRLSRGWLGCAVHLAGLPLALFLGGYTGVLLAATATQSGAQRRLVLGPLFLASGVSNGLAAVSLAVNAADSASPPAQCCRRPGTRGVAGGERGRLGVAGRGLSVRVGWASCSG